MEDAAACGKRSETGSQGEPSMPQHTQPCVTACELQEESMLQHMRSMLRHARGRKIGRIEYAEAYECECHDMGPNVGKNKSLVLNRLVMYEELKLGFSRLVLLFKESCIHH